jgi:hypothetical protein
MAEEQPSEEPTRRHRYRVFITAESIILLLTILLCAGLLRSAFYAAWMGVLISILWMWHIVAIPICFFYLIGKPIQITLVPLVDSPESKAFRTKLRERAALSDPEFHARFYADSGIPGAVSAGVRRALRALHPLFERAIPTDRLYFLHDELDFDRDVLESTEREFKIRFSKADRETVDGTLDNLVRLVHRRLTSEPP